MSYYGQKEETILADYTVDDSEILAYITETPGRQTYFMSALADEPVLPEPATVVSLPSIDRDNFMKELRIQFTLLKLDWPL